VSDVVCRYGCKVAFGSAADFCANAAATVGTAFTATRNVNRVFIASI
jgi:hypothetical protein